jgi:hypothetical protein
MEANVIAERIGAVEDFPGALLRNRIVNDKFDSFVPPEMTNDFRIHPGDRLKFPRPVVAKMRPSQPRRLMRLPFCRHAKAIDRRLRSGNRRSSWHAPQRLSLLIQPQSGQRMQPTAQQAAEKTLDSYQGMPSGIP